MSYKKDMSKYEHLEGWERCGFGEQLDKWAEKYGERTAVTDSEDEISYMELKQKADCLAAAFLRKGILKGDKVLVQLPNRISFVIVFFQDWGGANHDAAGPQGGGTGRNY